MAIKSSRPLAAACAALLAGCTTVSSEHVGAGELLNDGRSDPSKPFCDTLPVPAPVRCERLRPAGEKPARIGSAGFAYFLPRQLARVTATRTGGPVDDMVKAWVKARGDVETAEAAIKSDRSAVRATEDALVDPKLNDAARPILNARLAEQKTALKDAEDALPEKKGAYDKATAALKGAVDHDSATRAQVARDAASSGAENRVVIGEVTANQISAAGPGAYKVALKIELLPPSADPAHAFLLSPRHSPLRDDEHKLVVSPAGLLTSTDIVATDRTADILVEVATFAGAIVGGPLPKARDGRNARATKNCAGSPDEFTGIVDFADAYSVVQLNDDLQCLGVRAEAVGRYWPANTRPVPDVRETDPGIEGIVYRTPVQVQVRIEKCVKTTGACKAGDPDWFPTEVLTLPLPQAGPISYVRQDAGFMTKTKYKLAFSDGILTSYDASRPSELLEVARTPMRLVNGVFDGISKVISLRTGQNNALAGLSASELAALQAQFAIQNGQIVGQTGLNASQLALLQSQFALQNGQITGQSGLNASRLALLQSQYALQGGQFVGETGLSNQQLALLQSQFALQGGQFVGQTGLTNQNLAMLQAQSGLAIGQNNLAVQQSASNLALTQALLRDQARRDALNRCVAEKIQASQSVDACLAAF